LVSRELEGAFVERAVCWRSDQARPNHRGLLWVKPHERPWQRFFLDAGFAVWEEWSEEDTMSELVELSDEIEELSALANERIGTVTFSALGVVIPTIRIALGAVREIRLAPEDPNDIESATVLEVR
jgi:hypothetical protein